MDIVDKVAAHLWGTRWDDPGSARAAAQRLADAGLLRQTDQPVLTINVRVPTADVRPPIGLIVDGWRPTELDSEEEQEKPPGLVGASCFRCGMTGGFPARGDAIDRAALAGAGWGVTLADGVVRFLCSDCAGR